MRALPVPPDLVAPGCRVTAVACNDERCAAAFSLPRSRPEVVGWADDDETTSYVAPESRTVTALALPPENCATVAVGGGAAGLFAIVDGRARRLALKSGGASLELDNRRLARKVHVAPHEHVLLPGVDAFIFLLSDL